MVIFWYKKLNMSKSSYCGNTVISLTTLHKKICDLEKTASSNSFRYRKCPEHICLLNNLYTRKRMNNVYAHRIIKTHENVDTQQNRLTHTVSFHGYILLGTSEESLSVWSFTLDGHWLAAQTEYTTANSRKILILFLFSSLFYRNSN